MISVSSVDHPELAIVQCFQSLAEGESQCLGLQFPFQQYYLPEQPVVQLLALAVVTNDAGTLTLSAAVGEYSRVRHEAISRLQAADEAESWAASEALPWFAAAKPIALTPIAIPKPWGQEIWYTGIEERGQSLVSAQGHSIPLPWLLALAPQYWVQGLERSLNLLKVLDPLPEKVYGDLYFELHEEKQEVYVVTHVDQTAWPEGRGGIRFGFEPQVREQYASTDAFKQAYLEAVDAYQQVRKTVDAQIDQLRVRDGVGLNEPVAVEQQKQWLQDVPQALRDEEERKREQMDRFVAVKSLGLGDVVKVPCFTPHSLMHGVRTVEFQTPVYERKILSFAQKVLTQSHWDTQSAVDIMQVDTPVAAPLRELLSDAGASLEEIVDFDDFTVLRLTLQPKATYCFDQPCAYSLIMSLNAEVEVNGDELVAEAALLMPQGLKAEIVNHSADSDVKLLISIPKSVV